MTSGAGREFPVRVYLSDGERTLEHAFSEPGTRVFVPPSSSRLHLIWTDRAWTPGGGDERRLGVKVSRG